MARRSFLIRVKPEILEAVQHWAEDELRSMNAQIEYLLRMSLKQAGRLPKKERQESKQ